MELNNSEHIVAKANTETDIPARIHGQQHASPTRHPILVPLVAKGAASTGSPTGFRTLNLTITLLSGTALSPPAQSIDSW